MIYFQEDLFSTAIKCIDDLHEFQDVKLDLDRIEYAKGIIGSSEGIMYANILDKELRKNIRQ